MYKIIHLPSDHDPNITHSLVTATINRLNSYSNYRISLFETLGNFLLPVTFPAEAEDFSLSDSQQSAIKQAPGMLPQVDQQCDSTWYDDGIANRIKNY